MDIPHLSNTLRSSPPSGLRASRLADLVVSALIAEASLTPKPGLVDLRGRGAHHDLDWMLMCHSAWALHPTFHAMAECGERIADQQTLRERIGQIGRDGEAAMMEATCGINTHRGAIWALGLLVTAAAQMPSTATPAAVATRAGEIARRRDPFAPPVTGNKGEQACRKYGVGGARSQARSNFPHVIDVALPCLAWSRRLGNDENSARLNCLLAIIATLDDTCILSRGGADALRSIQAGAHRVLAAGGVSGKEGKFALQELEREMIEKNVSPGGAADLLAAALFLDQLAGPG